jgi:hypothetical protein
MRIIQTYIGITEEKINKGDLVFVKVNDKGEVSVRKYQKGDKKVNL